MIITEFLTASRDNVNGFPKAAGVAFTILLFPAGFRHLFVLLQVVDYLNLLSQYKLSLTTPVGFSTIRQISKRFHSSATKTLDYFLVI